MMGAIGGIIAGRAIMEATRLKMEAETATYQSLNGWRAAGLGALEALTLKPCPYCHRTEQKRGRKSCDGCGAPR